MKPAIDYYFTLSSPWTYLGHDRFAAMAHKAGAPIRLRPVDYGKVFPVSGGLPLKQRPLQRQAYRMMELKRWPAHLGIPLNPEPAFFPVPSDDAALIVIAADHEGNDGSTDAGMRLAGAILRACWAEERNIADHAVLAACADQCGLDGRALLEASRADAVRQRYQDYTADAIAAQVFGAPTYLYQGEMFWGQDRLEFLARALDRPAS